MKKLYIGIVAIIITLTSCTGNESNIVVDSTKQSAFVEYTELTLRGMNIAYQETERIQESINKGNIPANVVFTNDSTELANSWKCTYNNNSGVLVGELYVTYSAARANNDAATYLVDCSKLKIKYTYNSTLQMFGTFTIAEKDRSNTQITNDIKTTEFGLSSTITPEISMNGIFEAVSEMRADTVSYTSISGKSTGMHTEYGSFTQNITRPLVIYGSATDMFIDGTMQLQASRLLNNDAIAVEYYSNRREIRYNDTMLTKFYTNN